MIQTKLSSHVTGLGLVFALAAGLAQAANPIVPKRGLNDPHIHIFGDRAYVFASHDRSPTNKAFVMDNWWVWSSPDLHRLLGGGCGLPQWKLLLLSLAEERTDRRDGG